MVNRTYYTKLHTDIIFCFYLFLMVMQMKIGETWQCQGVKNSTLASQPTLLPLNSHCCLSTYIVASQLTLLPLNSHCCLSTYIVASQLTLLPLNSHCCLSTYIVTSAPTLLPLHLHCCLLNYIVASQLTLLPLNLHCHLWTYIAAFQPLSRYSMTKYSILNLNQLGWLPNVPCHLNWNFEVFQIVQCSP